MRKSIWYFLKTMGEYLSIDEVSLSKGELYTFVTNKKGNSKQGTMVACIKGTRSEDIIVVLEKPPLASRKQFREITLDMAKNMESSVSMAFPEATLVTNRFHVVKLAMEP